MTEHVGREFAVALGDGRRLAVAEWGPSDGIPVLAFHGLPNSRLVHFRGAPERQGVRLLLPDRPGLGRSDPQPGRTLLAWADDVAELCGILDIERFAVLGISAGGPHAAACAWAMPDRVVVLGLVSSVGPVVDQPDVANGLPGPWRELASLARDDRTSAARKARDLCSEELTLLRSDPRRWIADWEASAPPSDRALIEEPEIRAMYVESCLEATLAGYAQELFLLLADPWGFALSEICIRSHVWHGAQDHTVPMIVADHVSASMTRCERTTYPDDGHLLMHAHEDEILDRLGRTVRS